MRDNVTSQPLTEAVIRDVIRRLRERPTWAPTLHEQYGASGGCLLCGANHRVGG